MQEQEYLPTELDQLILNLTEQWYRKEIDLCAAINLIEQWKKDKVAKMEAFINDPNPEKVNNLTREAFVKMKADLYEYTNWLLHMPQEEHLKLIGWERTEATEIYYVFYLEGN